MLTAKKKAFVDYYKQTRNGADAARQAGYSEKYAAVMAYRLLHSDKDIQRLINEWEESERSRTTEIVNRLRPSKDKYIEMTFKKAEETEHAPTAAKYWELAGKASNYLTEEQKQDQNVINILCTELNLTPSLSHSQALNLIVNKTQQLDSKLTPLYESKASSTSNSGSMSYNSGSVNTKPIDPTLPLAQDMIAQPCPSNKKIEASNDV